MKKQKILEMIERNEYIRKHQDVMDIVEPKEDRILGFYRKSEKNWFPKIPELEQDFAILKQEVKEVVQKVDEHKKMIQKFSKKCDHKVRLEYGSCFWSSSECVLCGKSINGDNCTNGGTIYNDVNRNRNCIMLYGGYYDEYGDLEQEYTYEKVYDIIRKILKDKSDNEEIDFISEFKKLHLKHCEIDEKEYKQEFYVLVIGGSNQIPISEEHHITGHKLLSSIDIAYLLHGNPKIKVELFDNQDTFDSYQFHQKFPATNISGIRFDHYQTLEELEEKIDGEREVPFNLIIDMSSLFKYQDGMITPYKTNFQKRFPKSQLIRIEKSSSYYEKELLEQLKEMLQTYQNAYLQSDKQYYYLEDESLKSTNLEDTYQNIKKLILEKK